MQLRFYKYHGTGNDFILLDNRDGNITLSTEQIARLCHRRFGVGADGLMLLEAAAGFDFHMKYYNSDGNESTMCGNGGRCITAFAHRLGIIADKAHFTAIDGTHNSTLNADGTVSLEMINVHDIELQEDHATVFTGSPHYVLWVNDVKHVDVFREGRRIRQSEQYAPNGINVNFAQLLNGKLWVRTYERGVEDETLSCGTGVVAVAIAATGSLTGNYDNSIETPGGTLRVTFAKDTPRSAKNVVLTGPAEFVFEGEMG
jgi:diaminopimelate epimerase